MIDVIDEGEGPTLAARDGSVELNDGRTLGFAEFGPKSGRPVMLFHGAPGSRLLCPDEELLQQADVRLVVPDRPGYGNSAPKPARLLLEWPDDVAQLGDRLGLDRFALVGWSAGAVHALACGVAWPDRLTSLVLLSSPCSAEDNPSLLDIVPGMSLVYEGAQGDRLGTEAAVAEFFSAYADDPRVNWYEQVKANFPNNPVFSNPSWDRNFYEHAAEGLRPGVMGYASDQVACGGPWGFRLGDVAAPVMHRYGDDDTPMTLASVETLDTSLRSCSSASWPGSGHGGIYPNFHEVLQLAS